MLSILQNRDKYANRKRKRNQIKNENKSTKLNDGIKLINYSIERQNK